MRVKVMVGMRINMSEGEDGGDSICENESKSRVIRVKTKVRVTVSVRMNLNMSIV